MDTLVRLSLNINERRAVIAKHKKYGAKMTVEAFLKIAPEIHGNIYKYKNLPKDRHAILPSTGKITYDCKICKTKGISQMLTNHLDRGCGCNTCSKNPEFRLPKRRWNDFQKLIAACQKLHGDSLFIKKFKLKNAQQRFKVHCSGCNTDFETSVQNLILKETGCVKCSKEASIIHTVGELIEFLKSFDHVTYDTTEIKRPINQKIKIRDYVPLKCSKCKYMRNVSVDAIYKDRPSCPECFGCLAYTVENIPRRSKNVHLVEYTFPKLEENTLDDAGESMIVIWCPKCTNTFTCSPHNHIHHQQGCPCQAKRLHKMEKTCVILLNKMEEPFIPQFKFPGIKWSFDFKLLKYKLIIEVDGKQHFDRVESWRTKEEFVRDRQRDCDKTALALSNGYSLLRIDCKSAGQMEEIILYVLEQLKNKEKHAFFTTNTMDYTWIYESEQVKPLLVF